MIDIELFEASSLGDVDKIKAALTKGANPNFFYTPDDQKNSLHVASQNGHLNACKILVDNGANINSISATSQSTPLIFAVQNNKIEIVKYLIASGASLNELNGYGNSALHIACRQGSPEIVQLLIEAGANCKIENHKDSTPLHFLGYSKFDSANKASQESLLAIAKALIDAGASVDTLDSRGNTPLLSACIGGNLSLMTFLVANGSDEKHRNDEGEGIENIALFHEYQDILKVFLKRTSVQSELK